MVLGEPEASRARDLGRGLWGAGAGVAPQRECGPAVSCRPLAPPRGPGLGWARRGGQAASARTADPGLLPPGAGRRRRCTAAG